MMPERRQERENCLPKWLVELWVQNDKLYKESVGGTAEGVGRRDRRERRRKRNDILSCHFSEEQGKRRLGTRCIWGQIKTNGWPFQPRLGDDQSSAPSRTLKLCAQKRRPFVFPENTSPCASVSKMGERTDIYFYLCIFKAMRAHGSGKNFKQYKRLSRVKCIHFLLDTFCLPPAHPLSTSRYQQVPLPSGL